MNIDKVYAERLVRGTLMPIARRAEVAKDLGAAKTEIVNLANVMIAVLEHLAEKK